MKEILLSPGGNHSEEIFLFDRDDPKIPESTFFRDYLFVWVGLLSQDKTKVIDQVRSKIDISSDLTLNMVTDRVDERKLPRYLPGAEHYDRRILAWQPTQEQYPSFLYLPGETATVQLKIVNYTDKTRKIDLNVRQYSLINSQCLERISKEIVLKPYSARSFRLKTLLTSDFELYRLEAVAKEKGKTVAMSKVMFDCIKPWKPVDYWGKRYHYRTAPGFHAWSYYSFVGADDNPLNWDVLSKIDNFWANLKRSQGIGKLSTSSWLPSGEHFRDWVSPSSEGIYESLCPAIPEHCRWLTTGTGLHPVCSHPI